MEGWVLLMNLAGLEVWVLWFFVERRARGRKLDASNAAAASQFEGIMRGLLDGLEARCGMGSQRGARWVLTGGRRGGRKPVGLGGDGRD